MKATATTAGAVTVFPFLLFFFFTAAVSPVLASNNNDSQKGPEGPPPEASSSQAGAGEHHLDKVRFYRQECIDQTKVDPALIDRADKGDFVDDPKLKCFSRCFYQKAGFVDDKGELLLDVIKEKIPEEADRAHALQVLDKCKDKKGADSCETVYLVHKCYFENISGKGDDDEKQSKN